MNITKEGIELIKHFESCKLNPYFDTRGIPTIGWGNTYYANGIKVKITDKAISQKEADDLLLIIIGKFIGEVKPLIKAQLSDNQFSAIISLVYNIGVANFKSSTLLKLLNKKPLDPKVIEEWNKWNKSNGEVLKGLQRRRASESHLYKYGELNFYEDLI